MTSAVSMESLFQMFPCVCECVCVCLLPSDKSQKVEQQSMCTLQTLCLLPGGSVCARLPHLPTCIRVPGLLFK